MFYTWDNVFLYNISGTLSSGYTLDFTTNVKLTFTTTGYSSARTGWTLTYASVLARKSP